MIRTLPELIEELENQAGDHHDARVWLVLGGKIHHVDYVDVVADNLLLCPGPPIPLESVVNG